MSHHAEPAAAAGRPSPAIAGAAVREQLERMLASPVFRNSKRYSSLFRYVVERALAGETDKLKERTLGVEVFGRPPYYDTNLDPVVRIAASEIRRRIAQYYYQAGRETEIRIDLPTGSYAPEFHPGAEAPTVAAAAPAAPAVRRRMPSPAVLAGAVLLTVLALLVWLKPWASSSVLDAFWDPVLKSKGPVLICVGAGAAGTGTQPAAAARGAAGASLGRNTLGFRDATMLARVAGLIESRGASFNVRSAAESTFADLRQGPVVLIGAFNNDWTLRLTAATRFGFDRSAERLAIVDRRAQPPREWAVSYDAAGALAPVEEDFALVSRLWDPSTESVVVIGAGLTSYGTFAASEFLTNANYMESLARQAPAGWESKSLQAVIATRVMNGSSGPPRVAAAHFW
jgi:hypothetical protein